MEEKSVNIDEMRIENRVLLTKVFVGSGDDYIMVSGNDLSMIDRFVAAGNRIVSLAQEMDAKTAELGDDTYDFEKAMESIRIRKDFAEKATQEMDMVFGVGATRKFFSDIYLEIPEFVPDTECFMDFFDSFVPVIEKMTEHKIKLEKLASKQRMAKYQPQDRKKKGTK